MKGSGVSSYSEIEAPDNFLCRDTYVDEIDIVVKRSVFVYSLHLGPSLKVQTFVFHIPRITYVM